MTKAPQRNSPTQSIADHLIMRFIFLSILLFAGLRSVNSNKSNIGITFGEKAKYEGLAKTYCKLYLILDRRITFCGATIIGPQKLLTAAHCLENVKRAFVCCGSTSCAPFAEGDHCILFDVEDYGFIHKGYLQAREDGQLYDDIAIIHLPVLIVKENIHVAELCRLETCGCRLDAYNRRAAIVHGCGVTEDGFTPDELRQTKVATVTFEHGIKAFWDIIRPYQQNYEIICVVSGTDNPKSNACFGDSGGPLIFNNSVTDIEEVCGVVSFGGPFCDNQFPSCYTAVASYFDFIYALKNAVCVKLANMKLQHLPVLNANSSLPNIGTANEIKDEAIKLSIFQAMSNYTLISKDNENVSSNEPKNEEVLEKSEEEEVLFGLGQSLNHNRSQ